MSKQLYFKLFSLELHSLALFDPLIGPYQVLPLQAKVDLGAQGNKWVLSIPLRSIRLLSVICRTFVLEGVFSSAEMHLVYSAALADWTSLEWEQMDSCLSYRDSTWWTAFGWHFLGGVYLFKRECFNLT